MLKRVKRALRSLVRPNIKTSTTKSVIKAFQDSLSDPSVVYFSWDLTNGSDTTVIIERGVKHGSNHLAERNGEYNCRGSEAEDVGRSRPRRSRRADC